MRNVIILSLLIMLLSCGTSKKSTTVTSKSWSNPPDSCNVVDSTDWQNVAVFRMEEKENPKWLNLQGEAIFDLKESISQMKDIPPDVIKAMQVRVASASGCILFVDLSDFYGSEMFPMRKDNEVYFYWGTPK